MPGIEQNEDQPEPAKYTVELGVAARFENPWELYAQPVKVQYARKGIRDSAIKEEAHCECESLSSLSESSQKQTQTKDNFEVNNIFNDNPELNMELNLAEATSTPDGNQTKNGILYSFEEIASVDRKYSIDELEDTLATDNFDINSKLYPSDSDIDNVMNRNYNMASSNTSNMSMDKTLSESENSFEHLNLTSSSDDMSGINKQDLDQSQSEIVSSPETTLKTEPQTKPKTKGKAKGKSGSSKLTSYLKGLTKKHKATDANQTETSKEVPENVKVENSNKSTDIKYVESSEKSEASNNVRELKSNITDLQTQTTHDLLSVIGSSVDPINIDGNKFETSVEKMSDKPDGINDLYTEYTNPNSPSVTMDVHQTATSILSTVPQYTTVSHQMVNKDNVQINTSGENIDFNVLSSTQIKSDDVITETRNKSDLNIQNDSNEEGSTKLDSFFKTLKSESKGKPHKGDMSTTSSESVNSDMDISNTLQTNTILVEFSNSESKMDDSFMSDVFSSYQTNSLEPKNNNMSAENNMFDAKSLDFDNQSIVSPEKEESPASVISDSGFLSQGSFIEDNKISESFSDDQLKSPNSEGNNLESIVEISQDMDSVFSPSQNLYVDNDNFLGNDSFSMLENEANIPEIGHKKDVKEDSFEDDLFEVNPSIIYESTDIQDRYYDQTPICEQSIIEEDESMISPPFVSDDLTQNGTNQFQFGDDFVDITPHGQTHDNDEKEVFPEENQDFWQEECVNLDESGKYFPIDKDFILGDSFVQVHHDDYQRDDKNMSDENLDESIADVEDERNFGNDYEIVLGNKPMKEFTVADFTNPDNQISERTLVERQLMDTALVSDHFSKDTSYRPDIVEPLEPSNESGKELLDAPKSDHIDEDTEFSKTNILENIADIEEFVTETLQSEQQSSTSLVANEHFLSDNLNSEHVDNEHCSLVESHDSENFHDNSDIHDSIDDFFDEIEKTDQVTKSYLALNQNDQLKVEDLMTANVVTKQDDVLELKETTPKDESNSNSDIEENFEIPEDETISKSVTTENHEIPKDETNSESITTETYEIPEDDTYIKSMTTENHEIQEDVTFSKSVTTENHEIQKDVTFGKSMTTENHEIQEDVTFGKSVTTENHEIPKDETNIDSMTTETYESPEDQTNSDSLTRESHHIPKNDTKSQTVTTENFENIFVEEVVNDENIDHCQNVFAEVENIEGPFNAENTEEMVDFEEMQKKNREMFMKLQDNEATLLNLQDEIIQSTELMDETTDHENTHSDDNDAEEDTNVSKDVDDSDTMLENITRDSENVHQEIDNQEEFHQNDQDITTSTPQASSLPHYMRQQEVTPVKSKQPVEESLSNQNTPSKQSKERSNSFNEKEHESSYSEFDEFNLRKMFEKSKDEPINISPTKSSAKSNQSKYVENKTENVDIEVISSATPLEEVIQPSVSVRNMLRKWEINRKDQEEMSLRPFNKLSKKWHSCGHIYYKSDNEADSWGNGATVSDKMASRPGSSDSDSRQQRPNKTTETKKDGGRTVTTTTTKTETVTEVTGGSRGGSSSSMKIKEDSTTSTPKQNGVETSRTSQITREEVRKTEQSRNMANVATAQPPVNNQQMLNDYDDEDEDGDDVYENVPSPARTDVFRETDIRTDLELPQSGRANSMKERLLRLAEESASGKRTADKELTPPPAMKGAIEAGVFESQPSQPRQDVYRFKDTRHEDPVPEKGKALNTVQKYKEIASREFKGPADKRELTPDKTGAGEYVSEPRAEHLTYEEQKLEAGVFESKPVVAENVSRYEDYVPEELPEIGTAKNIASKFKEIEKNAHMPKTAANRREVTPDRHGRGEYITEPRAQHLTYEERVEGGVYENQPAAVRDDIYRHEDFYTPDPVPEKGYAKNLVSRYREIEKNAAVPKPSVRQVTPPREDSKNVYENVPTDSPIAYKETITTEDVLPEKGKAKNLASKYKVIEQENLRAKSGNRQVKEFTPPKDERTVFESTPRDSGIRYEDTAVESGILENQPTVRDDIYRESDPKDIEVELPERGAAKNLLNRWKQIESESANKTPPTPGRYKEFTPPRTDDRVKEQRAPLSPGIQNNSVQPNDLPGQYQQAGGEPVVFESTPNAPREDLYRESDTDWSAGLPKANKTKKMLSKFQTIQQKAQEPVTSSAKKDEPEYTIPSIKDNKPKKGGFFVAVQNDKCGACQKTVYAMEKIEMNKNHYHRACLKCSQCSAVLTPKTFAINAGTMYCTSHYKQLFARKGNYDEGFGRPQHKKKWKSEPNLLADNELHEHEIEA